MEPVFTSTIWISYGFCNAFNFTSNNNNNNNIMLQMALNAHNMRLSQINRIGYLVFLPLFLHIDWWKKQPTNCVVYWNTEYKIISKLTILLNKINHFFCFHLNLLILHWDVSRIFFLYFFVIFMFRCIHFHRFGTSKDIHHYTKQMKNEYVDHNFH